MFDPATIFDEAILTDTDSLSRPDVHLGNRTLIPLAMVRLVVPIVFLARQHPISV